MKNISTKKSVVFIATVIVLILAGIIISVSTDKNRKKQEADSKASVSVTRTNLRMKHHLNNRILRSRQMLRYCLRIRLYRLGQA